MSRSFGPIVRTEKVKEPNKFFYIACEGHVTEVKYFQELNNVGELCKFIHFERPSEERTNSSPKNVFNTLKKNVIKEGEPYRVCRRPLFLRECPDEKSKIHP